MKNNFLTWYAAENSYILLYGENPSRRLNPPRLNCVAIPFAARERDKRWKHVVAQITVILFSDR